MSWRRVGTLPLSGASIGGSNLALKYKTRMKEADKYKRNSLPQKVLISIVNNFVQQGHILIFFS
jgi:hypothetical protein